MTALIQALKLYFRFYNEQRPHQSLGDKTPAEVYWGEPAVLQAA